MEHEPVTLIQNVIGLDLPRIDHADGVWLVDAAGRRYLDGASGAAVTAIGHNHPHVVAAMRHQAGRVTFVHRAAFTSDALEELATRLAGWTGMDGVWFVNSGSEAVEAAMQFALQYFQETGHPERQWFLSHDRGYHGNTLGGLSLSGHARRAVMSAHARPFPVLPAPYAYRDAGGMDEHEYSRRLLEVARARFTEHRDTLAGVVVEPVGGATLGATVPPPGYQAGLRALCDEFGALLITDEVMSGLGRTGTVLAGEHWQVRADITAVGKGLGAGYTAIAATLLDQRVLDAITHGSGRILGGHTYAGNPFSAATALAVLDVLQRDDVLARGASAGEQLRKGLVSLSEHHPLIGDVRGAGLLLAVEFVTDRATRTVDLPQGQLANLVWRAAVDAGAILYATTGGFNDAVLVAPPLTISPDEVDLLVTALDRALDRCGPTPGARSSGEASR
jgi:adenosylmethionine-8-amino-7-oxononanoate aminotransferase